MVMSSIENIESYHAVFADSLRQIFAAFSRKDKELAHELIKYNIWYAFTIYQCDEFDTIKPDKIHKKIEALDLDKKELPELVVIMTYYQSMAGLRPVQEFEQKSKIFRRFMQR